VARVAVDVSLSHLDRPFDYLVPEALAEAAVAGCRVRVRFAGQLVGGFVLDRVAESEHPGKLAYLERVLSAEPVLAPEIAWLARAVADRYAGTMADVLRLAVPPRHAAAEGGAFLGGPDQPPSPSAFLGGTDQPPRPPDAIRSGTAHPREWQRYPAGASFLAALAEGRAPRAVWAALPGSGWAQEIAQAVATVAAAGRGSVVVVPDARDAELVDCALAAALGPGRHVQLSADLGPAERYRRFLAVARGQVRVVCGTRSAMFAPVAELGLVVIWDDGDDLHAEPRAPYPHARDVLALRAQHGAAAALIGGFATTPEAARLVSVGWARLLAADRATIRRHAPLVSATGEDSELARDEAARTARLPSLALRTARAALATGPVLFQVPRRGYLAAVSCGRCHARVRCARCGGPVALPAAAAAPRCGWCGAAADRACAQCGHVGLRALVTGARRTAEELGRAFPSVPVRTSGRAGIIARLPDSPAVVVATPGAEPAVDGGYAAAILLDGWVLLGRASLRAGEEALRRWLNAAALVRAGEAGQQPGTVIVVAEAGLPAVQALIRWDPVTHAERELAERGELGFPPAVRMASLTGPAEAVRGLVNAAVLPPGAELLGPVPPAARRPGGGVAAPADQVRFLIRVPRSAGAGLAAALQQAQRVRSTRKDPGSVRVQLDPAELI
jgi:primosomal protein N' (replication factor Y) (superfamily II helicase)